MLHFVEDSGRTAAQQGRRRLAPWTLPRPGSPLETTVTAVLNWCDAHEMQFFLMHNIQYDGLDGAYENPLGAAGLLTDWLRVLKAHKCVAGVILGNEVGPTPGDPQKSPKWWAGFIADLQARHTTIESLNAAWETGFADFASILPPKSGSPGVVDYQRFAIQVFDRFYGTLFRQVCEPALGQLLYGPKTSGDPLLHRACGSFSMICWDDGLSDYPQWRVKAMGDVSRRAGKPVFNSELHLYHDTYAYFGSPSKSLYRYFLSALDGEWMSASFAWGQWTKPGAQQIHRATPAILADLRRLEPQLRAISLATPEIHVVLAGPWAGDDTVMQRLYTEIACLGSSWEFVCPQDISRIATGAVYVPQDSPPGDVLADVGRGLVRLQGKKWGKHPACLSIHRVKRKLEAYATASVTPRLSLDDALGCPAVPCWPHTNASLPL